MNISITYSPSTLEDFLSALEAVQGFKSKAVTVKNPSAESDPVSLYIARIGSGRYRRTPESCAANLSNLEDLKKRAANGDEIAMECLASDSEETATFDTMQGEKDSIIERLF
jgi:hypothetical protein